MNLSYRLRKEFAHKLAVAKAGTQFVDEKEIGDGKVLTYNVRTKNLEYTTPAAPTSGPATQITETGGPTTLDIAAIVDGQFLQRSGTTIVSSAGAGYSDEAAQDAIGTILVDSSTIDFTYTDATPAITASIKAGSVTEAMQVLADNTTNNVSITAHGYVPKAPNITTQFLRGDGTWAAPLIFALTTSAVVTSFAGYLNPTFLATSVSVS